MHITCRYIEHFLRAGGLPEVCASADGLRAEQRVGTCRIDFVLARRDSIEVRSTTAQFSNHSRSFHPVEERGQVWSERKRKLTSLVSRRKRVCGM